MIGIYLQSDVGRPAGVVRSRLTRCLCGGRSGESVQRRLVLHVGYKAPLLDAIALCGPLLASFTRLEVCICAFGSAVAIVCRGIVVGLQGLWGLTTYTWYQYSSIQKRVATYWKAWKRMDVRSCPLDSLQIALL